VSTRPFALVLLVACAVVKQEDVGSSSERLGVTMGAQTFVDNPSFVSGIVDWNLAAAFTSGAAIGPTWSITFEDHSPNQPMFGWAFAGSASGPFTRCFDGAAGCNVIDKSQLVPFNSWQGEPGAVGDALGDVVASFGYSSTTPGQGDQIAIVLSADGGRHFGDTPGRVMSVTQGVSGCNTAARGSNVTIDPTTSPPTVYVVWGSKGAGAYSFGGCIRTFLISNGMLQNGGPITNGAPIANMDVECCQPSTGQGALLVQATDGMATVVYSNQDQVPATTSSGDCQSNRSIAWGSVSTVDGVHWTDHSRIFRTTTFEWCGLGTSNGVDDGSSTIIKGRREFDFIIAPDGNSYVALNDSVSTIRLFMSTTRGIKIPGANAPNDSPWREFCPSTVAGYGSNWLNPGDGPCTAFGGALVRGGQEVFRPTLAADGNSQLSLLFYVRNDSGGFGTTRAEVRYMGNVAPRTAFNSWITAPPLDIFPANFGLLLDPHVALGTYNSMPSTSLKAAGCNGRNDVEPYWTTNISAAQAIASRSMTLVP